MLQAGIARISITPPVGMTMPGYISREFVAVDKDGELTATALVLADGKTKLVIMAVDLVFIQDPLATELRHSIGQRLGIPYSHVLINASHTHCSPAIEQFQCDDDPHQEGLRKAHSARLRVELPALAAMAHQRLQNARLGTDAGEARIGINRRETEPDGTVLLGENPSGPVDHEVRVIRVDDLAGKPIALAFAHGCHTVTMGPKFPGYSADYVEPARDLVEQTTGCLSLFLQANAGDVNPITGIGNTPDGSREKNRLGTMLGAEVLKVQANIYTDSVRGPQTFMASLAKIRFYNRVPLDRERDTTIQVLEETVELPMQALPSLAEAMEMLRREEAAVKDGIAKGASFGKMSIARWNRLWAKALVDHIKSGSKNAIEIPVQALRIGQELAIVAVPAETFSRLGLEVKEKSPFGNTLFLGYSNGCASYIPTRDAYPPGGWSLNEEYFIPDLLFQGYLLPTALTPDCNELIANKALDLLGCLHASAVSTSL
jgi:neutral ceramidase